MAMRLEENTSLKALRLSLVDGKKKVSQEKIARRAGTSLQTYRCAERGEDVLLSTAKAIWSALNEERSAFGLGPVSFEQTWKIL